MFLDFDDMPNFEYIVVTKFLWSSPQCAHIKLSNFMWFHHVLLNGFVTCSSSSQCLLLVLFPSGCQCVHIKFWILWFPACSSEWLCNLFLKFSMCVPHHVPIRLSMCSHQVLNFVVPSMHVLLNGFVTCSSSSQCVHTSSSPLCGSTMFLLY